MKEAEVRGSEKMYGLGNQQPSREQRKVQRLSREGVRRKRLAVEVEGVPMGRRYSLYLIER